MSLSQKISAVIIISLWFMMAVPYLFVCLRNFKKITKSFANIHGWFSKIVFFLLSSVVLFLPQTRLEPDYFWSLIVGYILSFVVVLVVPGKTISLIKMNAHRTSRDFHLTPKVVFKDEFSYLNILWHSRFVLVIIPVVVLLVLK